VSSHINIKTNENLEFIPELLVGEAEKSWRTLGGRGAGEGRGKGGKPDF